MADSIPMTPAGHAKMKEELDRLKKVERPKNVRDIEEARGHGDLSENAEYHAAKERQGHIATRMAELEDRLSRAQIIDPTKLSGDRVKFGATVKLSNVDTGDEVTYQIVGADEADADKGTISITSPIARALIGREPGDEVKVRAPGGERAYEILDVEFK
jgi:transcription elongation factor GreA